MIRKSFALEAKTVDEAEGIVDAIVNVTGHIDRQKDMVHPGAFSRAVNGKLPKVVNSHQGSEFLGKVLSMREMLPGDSALPKTLSEKGLGGFAVKMQFNLETQAGREMFSNVKGGFVDEWSFMFTIADANYDAKGVRHIKLIDEIFEVSPVLVGASPGTLTMATKGLELLSADGKVSKAHELLDKLRVIHGYFKSDVSTKPKRARARFSIRTSEGPKYPINDCSDVHDAWSLRGRSSIPRERVERHVRRAAAALHCDGPWNSGKAFDPNDCPECDEQKDAPLPPLEGDEAEHNEPFMHAIDDIKELIAQELAEEEPEADCVMELASIWQSLLNWYEGEMNEYDSDSSPMQAYSATPNIPALRELTARAIAAGVSAGRSRKR